jgi:hypothetical protein
VLFEREGGLDKTGQTTGIRRLYNRAPSCSSNNNKRAYARM